MSSIFSPRIFAGSVLTILLAGAVAAGARAQLPVDLSKFVCHTNIRAIEQQAGIPTQLLESIALVESSKWYDPIKRTIAWPWTVMAEGKGRYFETKQAAIAEVQSLKARGVRNIDVGCMQVNLMHHADAFSSLEEAFDPTANVRYGAKFLLNLKSRFGTWSNAVGYYHSATPTFHFNYRKKVLAMWQKTRQIALNGSAIPSSYTVIADNSIDSTPVPAAPAPQPRSVQRYYPVVQQSPAQMRYQLMNLRRSSHLKVITF